MKLYHNNQVAWTPVVRSSFQGRIRGLLGSNPRENKYWPVRMPLRTNRISRPPLVGRKPVRKPKKKKKLYHNDLEKGFCLQSRSFFKFLWNRRDILTWKVPIWGKMEHL